MTEIMFAVFITGMVMAGAWGVYLASHRVWRATSLDMRTSHEASMILERMVYGFGPNSGIRAASAASVSVATNIGDLTWILTYSTPDGSTNNLSYSFTNRLMFYNNPGMGTNLARIGEKVTWAEIATSGVGVLVSVRIGDTDGRFNSTNEKSTFVTYRN